MSTHNSYEESEPEIKVVVSYHPSAYRDAIIKRIPSGKDMVADVRVHDGLVDATLRCGQLRWSSAQAIAGQTPEQVADNVEATFKGWLVNTFANVMKEPKYRRASVFFQEYLNESPERRLWLHGAQPGEAAGKELDAP